MFSVTAYKTGGLVATELIEDPCTPSLNAYHALSAAAPLCVRKIDRSVATAALDLLKGTISEVRHANADHVGVL